MRRTARPHPHGFTLIELVIVMAMIGLLLSIAVPPFMKALNRGREQVLQHDLFTMREAIDKFHGDRGRYPERLEDLVTEGYLRAIPDDPFSESPTWVVIEPKDRSQGGVIDVQSTRTDATGQARLQASPLPPEPVSPMVLNEGGARQAVVVDMAASAVARVSP